MKWFKRNQLPLLCGAGTFLIDFWLIPAFLMRGVEDWIWMGLWFLLPMILAQILLGMLGKAKPASVFWGLLVQYLIIAVAFQPLGGWLGFRLGEGFETLSYLAYVIFLPLGVTLAQFAVLLAVKLIKRK